VSDGFGLDNLPYGAVARPGEEPWLAARIGDAALPLAPLGGDLPPGTLAGPTLNPLLALGRPAWTALRQAVRDAAQSGAETIPLAELEPGLPIAVGDYVDFYSSLEHATNLGRMFRPDTEPLLPNWRHLPVGYHGRASSVVVSGTPIRRPHGQLPTDSGPVFGPTQRLDIELELGFVTGPGNELGTSIPTSAAAEHVFGFVVVNDWSARDIQRWEYQPLGPFLGKSFATSISPWVVPLEALEPFRLAAPPQDPEPLDYLRTEGNWALDIALEVELNGEVISRTNARGLYWTFPQQLAHATVNGTNVRAGDLYASGTISGAEPGSQGSLIELGHPFLQDGDTVVLRGGAGDTVSFGEVTGTIVP
jgi:fumarylacetoacetase